MRLYSVGIWLLVVALVWGAGLASAQEARLALIIANEDYPAEIGRLTNTHEDAAVVETALTAAGFSVTKVLDANAADMGEALTNFELAINASAAEGNDVVAFFYGSMHGAAAEDNGATRNFLLPAREDIRSTGELIRKAVRMDQMISGLSATNAAAVLVVSDACRNNMATAFSKSTTKGFVAEKTRPGVLVAYATAPGSTTPDDGLFARVLSDELLAGGRKASYAMLETVEKVGRQRSFQGQPFLTSGGLPEWLCFNGCAGGAAPAVAPRDIDQEDWDRFNATGSEAAYQTYLALHPNGRYEAEARQALHAAKLDRQTVEGGEPVPATTADLTTPEAQLLTFLRLGRDPCDAPDCWITLDEVVFSTGRATVDMDHSFEQIKSIVGVLLQKSSLKIEVAANTDSAGSEAMNLRLSEGRAQAVAKVFLELGAGADQIVARGYGESRPIADNGTAEGRARNRRVDFRVVRR